MSVRQPGPASQPLTVSRRSKTIAISIVVLLLLVQIVPRLNNVYTDWLWFGSVDAQQVMRTELISRFVLFLVVGLLVAGSVVLGTYLANRFKPVFLPPAGDQDSLAKYRDALATGSKLSRYGIPVVLGVLTGLIAQTSWQTVLAFLNRTPFGEVDAQFGHDISFYAFTLPFLRLVLTWLMVATVIAFLANLITHYLVGGVRPGTREGMFTNASRIQLASIAGFFVLLKAGAYWLDRYDLLFSDHTTFTGASYTDLNALMPAKIFLFAIALLTVAAFFSVIFLRDLRIPALATALLIFSSLVGGSLYPLVVEQAFVNPNRAERERESISRNIDATRAAYAIGDDNVNYVENWGAATPDPDAAAEDLATLSNVRILDPNVLSPTFTQQQQLRNFYGFPEQLNVDRYTVDGELRDFIVSARELNPESLQGNQRDWINRHTVYTHGNGFVSAPANRVNEIADDAGSDRGGLPNYQISDLDAIENERDMMIPVEQPRVYFGELIAQSDPDYAIVGDNGDGPREYDTDTSSYTYTGEGGVPIDNFFKRSAYALKFAERNILLSGIIGSESKIIHDRDPRDRVKRVAPWLETDQETYPAVIDGRIQWIVDGYTTLDSYPYSQGTSLEATTSDSTTDAAPGRVMPDREISYIRNSVKATVDAYDGTVTLYEYDEEDPVLQTWMDAIPGIVQPKEEISDELQEHLRYPEDLFKIQRELLARYQVEDPGVFFTNDAFWSVPSDPTVTRSIQDGPTAQQPGGGAPGAPQDAISEDDGPAQPPYYVVAADPQTGEPSFQLVSAFRGYERQYLAAHMSASSDPETYGEITVREQRTTEPLAQGPVQAQDIMIAAPAIAADRRLWGETAEITEGNLLALPLADDSMLYVEPIYTQRRDQDTAFPRLLRVMVSYDRQVGYAPTLYEALLQVGIDLNPEDVRIDETGTAEEEAEAAPFDPESLEEGTTGGSGTTSDDDDDDGPATGATAPTTGGSPADQADAVQDLNEALEAVRAAQQGGDFGELGEALEALQEAVDAYQALSG